MNPIIRHAALLLCCLTGLSPAMAADTPSLGTGEDAPKAAHHEMSLEDKLGGLPRGQGLGHPGSGGIADKLLNNANWNNQSSWGDLVYLAMLSPQTYPKLG